MAGKPRQRLTPKQRKFLLEYQIDFNGSEAAIRAGYSPKTAKETAYKLLRHRLIEAALRQDQNRLAQKLEMKAEDVAREFVKIARANVTDYLTFGPDGVQLKESAALAPEHLSAIAEVREVFGAEGRRGVAFKLHSKLDALQALGKHLGMFVERHEHEVKSADVHFYLPDNGRRPGQS